MCRSIFEKIRNLIIQKNSNRNQEYQNDKLILTHNKYKDIELEFCGLENLMCDYWWMNHLTVSRNNKYKINGFELNNERVTHLKFYKRK